MCLGTAGCEERGKLVRNANVALDYDRPDRRRSSITLAAAPQTFFSYPLTALFSNRTRMFGPAWPLHDLRPDQQSWQAIRTAPIDAKSQSIAGIHRLLEGQKMGTAILVPKHGAALAKHPAM